jgi:hypothetical protein
MPDSTIHSIASLVKAVERTGGRTGGRKKRGCGKKWPKGRKIRRTVSSARLQSANLGKGQWFAAGFMVEFYKRENSHPLRFAKDFGEKS